MLEAWPKTASLAAVVGNTPPRVSGWALRNESRDAASYSHQVSTRMAHHNLSVAVALGVLKMAGGKPSLATTLRRINLTQTPGLYGNSSGVSKSKPSLCLRRGCELALVG